MPVPAFFSAISLSGLFVLLISLAILTGCVSHSPAPVLEKSQGATRRPATHIVIPGDTLFSIAWRYGLKYEALAEHNGIRAPYIIRPSQVIRLDIPGSPSARVTASSTSKSKVQSPTVTAKTQTPAPPKITNRSQIKQTPPVAASSPKNLSSGTVDWRWPAKGPLLSAFQSNSGLNKGIDIGGKLGEPVLAAASGKVVYSGSGLRGYGKLLIVKHSETFLSAYAHNHVLRVAEGDIVKAGQVIAEMGSSGTDRVKLHFEIRRDGTPVDPMKYLPRR